MDTQELVSNANHLAEEIRCIVLHSNEPRHRQALKYAEALARSLAHELERTAQEWPEAASSADDASSRSY